MAAHTSRTRQQFAAGAIVVLTIIAALAERAGLLSDIRPALLDAFSPGRMALLAMSSPSESVVNSADSTDFASVDRHELARNHNLLRQALIDNARLRRDLKRAQSESAIAERAEPAGMLVRFEVVRASVLSSSGLPAALRELMIDTGRSAGITRSELVVDGSGLLIDAGTSRSLEDGDRVLTGTIVVGRVAKAARWVSLVQPLTAEGFKAQVTLMRTTSEGQHFGATGLLEGTGEANCRITGLAHTDVVAVGDDVVSADVNGLHGPRLYFGKVTRADFLAGGQWDVRVQPAVTFSELESVGVLKTTLNAEAP